MAVTPVPEFDSGQRALAQPLYGNPYSAAWWLGQVITDIPQEAVGWLVAQGWQITGIEYDETFRPPTPYYTMARESLQNWQILKALVDSFVDTTNLALENNAVRYNDVVRSWTDAIETSHDYFEIQATTQENHETDFLATLEGYMVEIDSLIAESQDQLSDLEPDFNAHNVQSPQYLLDLGATELAWINEAFDAALATQLQQLTDRGLYSAGIAADITERNARDRDEQIQQLNDRLNREKLDNDHRLYEQQVNMRGRVIDGTTRIIADKLTQSNARLAGKQAKHAENMALMQYQLDTRNQLLVGIYGFVERRDDVAPSFESLVQITTGLGDAGGGWVTP